MKTAVALCHKFTERNNKFGTHNLRKTGYLFAVWGKGDIQDIMKAARHKSIDIAMRYKQDVSYLLQVEAETGNHAHSVVSKWKTCFAANLQVAQKLSGRVGGKTYDLLKLSELALDNQILAGGKWWEPLTR